MPTTLLRALLMLLVVAMAAGGCRSVCTETATGPYGVPGAAGLERAVRSVRVVHAGELHDDLAQHRFQLELLRTMVDDARRDGGAPVLLGMEMFQRPYQAHLDDYVAGRIDECEMLRRTEYFTRWKFDHTYYAPLWQFAREHGVRVVALNAEASIVTAVRMGGIAKLTPEQRAGIAAEIDLSVPAHRERTVGVLQRVHPMPEEAMQTWYEAMTTWDETMAESAARALEAAGPRSRMLVVAGSQHVQEWTGIPDRITRRMPEVDSIVVVMRTEGRFDPAEKGRELGDFQGVLGPVAGQAQRRLGGGRGGAAEPQGLRVESVAEFTSAAVAGIAVDDIVTHVGGRPVTDIVDLRYVLERASIGDTLPVRLLRDGRPVVVQLTLHPPPPPPAG